MCVCVFLYILLPNSLDETVIERVIDTSLFSSVKTHFRMENRTTKTPNKDICYIRHSLVGNEQKNSETISPVFWLVVVGLVHSTQSGFLLFRLFFSWVCFVG